MPLTLDEEKALVSRSRHDPEAFGAIYDTYCDAIHRYIARRLSQADMAEELTAQVFFKALDNLWRFRWTGISIRSWLYRIATNEVNQYLRQQRRRNQVSLDSMPDNVPDNVMGRLPQSFDRPDLRLEEIEARNARAADYERLRVALKRLKPTDQSLVTMHYMENMTYARIAGILGCREGTVRMRAKRALERLAGYINAGGGR